MAKKEIKEQEVKEDVKKEEIKSEPNVINKTGNVKFTEA